MLVLMMGRKWSRNQNLVLSGVDEMDKGDALERLRLPPILSRLAYSARWSERPALHVIARLQL